MSRIMDNNDTTPMVPQYSSDAEWYIKFNETYGEYYDLLFFAFRKMGISPAQLSDSERELVCKVVRVFHDFLKEKK